MPYFVGRSVHVSFVNSCCVYGIFMILFGTKHIALYIWFKNMYTGKRIRSSWNDLISLANSTGSPENSIKFNLIVHFHWLCHASNHWNWNVLKADEKSFQQRKKHLFVNTVLVWNLYNAHKNAHYLLPVAIYSTTSFGYKIECLSNVSR